MVFNVKVIDVDHPLTLFQLPAYAPVGEIWDAARVMKSRYDDDDKFIKWDIVVRFVDPQDPQAPHPNKVWALGFLSRRVLSCLVLSCRVLSCPVLSCVVLSCLVLSRLVPSYLVLAFQAKGRLRKQNQNNGGEGGEDGGKDESSDDDTEPPLWDGGDVGWCVRLRAFSVVLFHVSRFPFMGSSLPALRG